MALRCLRVGAVHSIKRVSFVMSAVCPVYPKHQTLPDPVGTSHLCQAKGRGPSDERQRFPRLHMFHFLEHWPNRDEPLAVPRTRVYAMR
jgi:hypothetical protein